MDSTEERTAPTAYGKMEVVCESCMTTTMHRIEVGPIGVSQQRLSCAYCEQVMVVSVTVFPDAEE